MPRTLAPAAWCLLAALLFGASTPLTKSLVEAVGPFLLAGLLYLGGALGVLPLVVRGGRRERRPAARSLALLAGATLSGGVLGPVLLLVSLRAAAASSVSLWLSMEPVATALIALVAFREAMQARIWAALGLALAASLVLASGDPAGPVAAMLALAACACWGLDNNFVARIDDLSPPAITFAKSLAAGATNAGLGLALGASLPGWTHAGAALAVGAAGYGLSICLFVAGAQQLGAVRAQLFFALAPLFGAAIAWAWLREPLDARTGAAAVALVVAALLASTARHEHEHVHPELAHSHLHRHDDGHHDHAHDDGAPPLRGGWHAHEHAHGLVRHAHAHVTDVHHSHAHDR